MRELIQPEHGVADQVLADVFFSIVIDETIPDASLFEDPDIQGNGVPSNWPGRAVNREMRGHPVHDDPDASLMAGIDEELKSSGELKRLVLANSPTGIDSPRSP